MRTNLIILISLVAMSAPADTQVSWWKWPGKWVGSKFRKAREGKLAPSPLGQTLDGQFRTASDYRSKSLLVSFWAPWSPPCLAGLDRLAELERRYGEERDTEILAVSVLTERVNLDSFLSDHTYLLTFLHDAHGDVAKAYGVVSLPTTVLVSEAGIVLRKWQGAGEMADLECQVGEYFAERSRIRQEESG